MPEGRSSTQVFTVLFVCTGNICRSAFAERLGRAYLDEALGASSGAVRLVSAGTQAVVGSEMHPDTALVLEGFGGSPSGHAGRQLVAELAVDADLTLTMTRGHRREVLQLAPRALSRTFTLREAADLLRLVGPDADLPGADLPERARNLVREMALARSRREGGAGDDIPDPIGQPVEVQQEAADAIAEALLPLLGRIASLSPGSG